MHHTAEEHDRQILEQFTEQAESFARAISHSNEESMQKLLATSEVAPADEVLDVACGPGIVACALASVARHVTGSDLTPAMLEEARKLQHARGLTNVRWQLADATRLPFDDASSSLVVTRYSMHHMLDPLAVLREMVRVCVPGGRILIADVTPAPGKAAAFDALDRLRDPSHTHALPLSELEELGRAAGLTPHRQDFYRLDVEVDGLLNDSFPPPGNAELFRQAVRADIGLNRLSIEAYEQDGTLRFLFPVSIVAWKKQ